MYNKYIKKDLKKCDDFFYNKYIVCTKLVAKWVPIKAHSLDAQFCLTALKQFYQETTKPAFQLRFCYNL